MRFIAKKPATLDAAKLNAGLVAFRFSPLVVQGDYVMTGPAGKLAESNKLLVGSDTLPINQAALAAAWATVKDLPVRVLIVPPAYLVSTYEDLMPRLPDSWGGTATTIITEGFQWATIGVDPANLKLHITIQSKSPAAAERLLAELPKLASGATKNPQLLKIKSTIDLLKFDKPRIVGDRIETTSSNAGDIGSATGSVMQMLGAIVDPLNVREKQNRFSGNSRSPFTTMKVPTGSCRRTKPVAAPMAVVISAGASTSALPGRSKALLRIQTQRVLGQRA